MEKEFFDLVGLGLPFYLSAATYGVFSWLDNNASDEATKVISLWLQGRSYRTIDFGNTIVSAFDRIYSSPLLSVKAFVRSATVSLCIWIIVLVIPLLVRQLSRAHALETLSHAYFWYNFDGVCGTLAFPTVISDYFSLFFVRRFLRLAKARPILASIGGSAVGLLIVILIYLIFIIIIAYFQGWKELTTRTGIYNAIEPDLIRVVAPALIIHL
jgi:hypothetical protein